jgi:hypothetical protein
VVALIAGCAAPPAPPPPPPEPPAPVALIEPTPPEPEPTLVPEPVVIPEKISQAQTPLFYRSDAANHLYAQNSARIFAGKLPPLLYAIAVLDVDIDALGAVTDIRWTRKPSQAPEVVVEIERLVREASPFPAPVRMGHVTYTEIWLWHHSGRFQLDTLTEGQL